MEVPLSSRYVRGGAVVGFAVEGCIVAGLMLLDQIVALGGRPRAGGLKNIRAIVSYNLNAVSAQKAFKGSEMETGELLGGTNEYFPNEQANQ